MARPTYAVAAQTMGAADAVLVSGRNSDETPWAYPDVFRGRSYTVATAATAVGSNSAFDAAVAFLVVYCTLDSFVSRTSAGTGTAGDGTVAGSLRYFVAAGERRSIFWNSAGFWVVNANTSELPTARVEGWS
jgi:hypothetical protein